MIQVYSALYQMTYFHEPIHYLKTVILSCIFAGQGFFQNHLDIKVGTPKTKP